MAARFCQAACLTESTSRRLERALDVAFVCFAEKYLGLTLLICLDYKGLLVGEKGCQAILDLHRLKGYLEEVISMH